MFKSQKGITLVALVITIIVLLILAGVSISLVVGQNGVLGKATNSVKAQKAAAAKEAVGMALNSLSTEYYAQWTGNQAVTRATVYTKAALANELEKSGYTLSDAEGGAKTTATTSLISDPAAPVTLYLKKDSDLLQIAITVTANGDVSAWTVQIKDNGSYVTVNNI
ncbi:MAG: hypothetical protein J6A36_00680 [Clostridia bacterium]|nr:hypothetical protein [Clostridia bacterium]